MGRMLIAPPTCGVGRRCCFSWHFQAGLGFSCFFFPFWHFLAFFGPFFVKIEKIAFFHTSRAFLKTLLFSKQDWAFPCFSWADNALHPHLWARMGNPTPAGPIALDSSL
jgi:hypothetical protein